jgi:tRNA A-37 threonylcarbamoyl transferase component Bud32
VSIISKVAGHVVKDFNNIHGGDICHGNIGGENIPVRPDQYVVVIDFGRGENNASEEAMREMREAKHFVDVV